MATRAAERSDPVRQVRPRLEGGDAPRGSTASLHLTSQFNAGPVAADCRPLWRSGSLSDWPVRLGEKSYGLHSFPLARASSFFAGHMAMAKESRGSDLTEVLPPACHGAFETALDYMYSENMASFEALTSEAVLLLKIAEVLGIRGLFEVASRKVEGELKEAAPVFMLQHCSFHIPGTDDGAALQTVSERALELLAQRFQSYVEEAREAMMRLPVEVLEKVLTLDELRVSSEDVVCGFVTQCSALGGASCLWKAVRWGHCSAEAIAEALAHDAAGGPEVAKAALSALAARDLRGCTLGQQVPRQQILPPGVPSPGPLDIDFCCLYRKDKFENGQALRSQPKQVGDLVLRLLVFPHGSPSTRGEGNWLSAFLEAVPQGHWRPDWEFVEVGYSISSLPWSGEKVEKADTWTFNAAGIDRGWHDVFAQEDIPRHLSPEGFLCIRASVKGSRKLFLPAE